MENMPVVIINKQKLKLKNGSQQSSVNDFNKLTQNSVER
jgi:hypothetical protein